MTPIRAAYLAGLAGREASDRWTPEQLDAYRDGLSDAANDTTTKDPEPASNVDTSTAGQPNGQPSKSPTVAAGRTVRHRSSRGTAGGFVLGVLAWVMVRAYLVEGPAGPVRWIAAKFINRTGGAVQ